MTRRDPLENERRDMETEREVDFFLTWDRAQREKQDATPIGETVLDSAIAIEGVEGTNE